LGVSAAKPQNLGVKTALAKPLKFYEKFYKKEQKKY
jgi:hypothetical protein